MEDNRFRREANNLDQELKFTKEDRNEVFKRIHNSQKNNIPQKYVSPLRKAIPLTSAFFIVGLCLFLFLPSMLPGNMTNETSSVSLNKEANPTVTGTTGTEEAKVLTTLITVKSEEMDDRIYLNLLLSYSTDKNMVKVVSIPYDTYVPVAEQDEETTLNGKLLFAYNYGGAKNVRTIVSKLFDIPIDHHAVIELRSFSSFIDSIGGVEYHLQDDMTVRGITQGTIEFKKGANQLNGEGVIALMMAATEPNNLDEGNLLKLMEAVIDKAENETSPNKLKVSFANSLSDMQLLDKDIRAFQQISLSGGMIDDAITINNTEGQHIYRLDEEFLNAVTKELTTFK